MSEDGITLSRLGPCNACQQHDAMYTCPRCSVNTCSLACVNRHKTDTGCSGKRNKTMFVSIQSFTETNLISDFRFLEDVCEKKDAAHRDQSLGLTPYQIEKRRLLQFTARRHGVNIDLLPDNFTRSLKNETKVARRNDLILWTVEWIFPHSGVMFTDTEINENKKPLELLGKYLNPASFNPIKRQQIKAYTKGGGLEKVKLLYKSKPFKNVSRRGFYEMDLDKSLRDNLRNMHVIEYPSFHVVLEDRISEFKILESFADQSSEISDDPRGRGVKRRRDGRRQRAEKFKKAKLEGEEETKMDTATSDGKDTRNGSTADPDKSGAKDGAKVDKTEGGTDPKKDGAAGKVESDKEKEGSVTDGKNAVGAPDSGQPRKAATQSPKKGKPEVASDITKTETAAVTTKDKSGTATVTTTDKPSTAAVTTKQKSAAAAVTTKDKSGTAALTTKDKSGTAAVTTKDKPSTTKDKSETAAVIKKGKSDTAAITTKDRSDTAVVTTKDKSGTAAVTTTDKPSTAAVTTKDKPSTAAVTTKDKPLTAAVTTKDKPSTAAVTTKDKPSTAAVTTKDKSDAGAKVAKKESVPVTTTEGSAVTTTESSAVTTKDRTESGATVAKKDHQSEIAADATVDEKGETEITPERKKGGKKGPASTKKTKPEESPPMRTTRRSSRRK